MKHLKSFLLVFCSVLFSSHLLFAAPIYKTNLGFEQGNFLGWKGYTWIYRTDFPSYSTSKVEGIVAGRQSIMNDQSAYDANTGGKLKIIPDGYTYSAKLGSTVKGGRNQSLSYTMKIDSTNALLVWEFAVVLLNPLSNHEKYEEPRFKISLFDENGDAISDCSNYDVYASDGEINGFQEYYPSGSKEPVVWRDWTTVGANLLPYYGQTITIEFMSADCTHKAHYGYGYFVLDCMPLSIIVDYCTGDSKATLAAPSGFKFYEWKDEAGSVVDSVQDLLVEDPKEGETYVCEMESETGCSVSLFSVIERYEQDVAYTAKMLDCFSNTVQFSNLSTHTKGTLLYAWDFGDGITSEEKDPAYTFQTSGMHEVRLIIYNPPSGCTDTLIKDVESFSPPLIGFNGDSTYCPNYDTKFTAFGAYGYEWSTGETSDSITIGAPGGDYWLLGHSSEGCVSDTIYLSVSEEADWPFVILGDSFLCEGSQSILIAEGATEYLWSTGNTSDSIHVYSGNSFTVTGKNARGCAKALSVTVTDVANPKMDFSLSTNTIDIRNNLVECEATSDENVDFKWDMGDGTISNNPMFSHNYLIPQELIAYKVTISCINEYGCSNIDSTYVAVEPFAPNVFTPNNDGINDLYLPGYNLKIFDRHGIVLYTGKSGWDGKYNGKQAVPDTYFYLLNYINGYNESREKKGFLTLIR